MDKNFPRLAQIHLYSWRKCLQIANYCKCGLGPTTCVLCTNIRRFAEGNNTAKCISGYMVHVCACTCIIYVVHALSCKQHTYGVIVNRIHDVPPVSADVATWPTCQ